MTISKYDRVPYLSDPLPAAHPDRLATVGLLFGMQPQPTPAPGARVLELGCGSGPTAVPMALSLPDAEIVAIDASDYQIDRLQRRVEQLEITNLHARKIDLLDFPDDAGQFDYIIAHGLYTWVGAEVRDAILKICRCHLKPNGIAFLSYNTKPGWDLTAPVRDFMLYHTRNEGEPKRQAAQARQLAEWVTKSLPNSLGSQRALFESLQENLQHAERAASYLAHDLMGGEMEPVLFSDFVDHAARHELRYLAETDVHKMRDQRLAAEIYQQVGSWTHNLVESQQYLDFLVGRRFRKSLLCHAAATSDTQVQPERLRGAFVSAFIKCQHPARRLCSDEAIEFTGVDNVKGTSQHPLTKAAWLILSETWPEPLRIDDLADRAAARLRAEDAASQQAGDRSQHVGDRDQSELLAALTQMYLLGTLEAFQHPSLICREVSRRPVASRLARLQAAEGEAVTNLMLRPVMTDVWQNALIQLLDGSRDRAALLDAWRAAMAATPPSAVHGNLAIPPADVLARRLDADLDAFARAALLVG